jgi:uncharacterized protein
MSRKLLLALAVGSLASVARAAVSYDTAGSTYGQNFDSLPNTPQNASLGNSPVGWTDDSTAPNAGNFSIPGWYLYHPVIQTEGGANGHQRMRIGAGTGNTGAFMSWGPSGSTNRGLGMLSSNTLAAGPGATPPDNFESYYGLRLTNNTGQTLGDFRLTFAAEQWRDGGTTTTWSVAQSLTFDYKVNAASIQDTGFIEVPALTFTSPRFGATAGTAYDGDAPENRQNFDVTVSGLSWAPGEDLWLRWTDLNDTGNDHGLGIDDLSFSATAAVPEPGTLSALAAVAMLRRRGRARK